MKCIKCSKHHDTGYKMCLACREYYREYKKKRKRLAEELTVPEGQCLCKQCYKLKPMEDFQSKVNRCDTLTTCCIDCREIKSTSQKIQPQNEVHAVHFGKIGGKNKHVSTADARITVSWKRIM